MATPRRLLQWPVLRYLLGRPRVPVISEQPLSNPLPANHAEGENCWTIGGVLVDSAQLHQAGSFLNASMSPAIAKQFEDSIEQTRLRIRQSLNELGTLKQLAADEANSLRMFCDRIEDLEDEFQDMSHDVDFLTLMSYNLRIAASSSLPHPIPANSSPVPAAASDNARDIVPTPQSNPIATTALENDEACAPSYTASKGI